MPIIHIEAGLRSYNRNMPEEINRIIADHVSKYLFAPTKTAADILEKEGLKENTFLTGDIMVDTMKDNLAIALKKSTILSRLNLENQEYNLLTLHRNYNVDNADVLNHIMSEMGNLEEKIIFPVHPRTQKMLANSSIPKNIQITEPQGYLDFITLENFSKKIITDSGGIQKEAYILKKPCITLRTETEWVETVDEKWNLLIDPLDNLIAAKISGFIPPSKQNEIFGTDVAKKMAAIINNLN
ncbi:MAG: UDP-N-acetylglucosamine 2-epimerase [Ferruginibacter sp.]